MRFRVITFDGGGVRGVLSAILLARIAQEFPEFIQKTNLVAGTSVGSFLALGIGSGKTPMEIVQMFSKETITKIFSNPNRIPIVRPRYQNAMLQKTLEDFFPSHLQLQDLVVPTIVTAFNVGNSHQKNWKPSFFHNFPESPFLTLPIVDVAMASSAAPIYFPSHQHHIDGGVFANSPSVAAIALAVDTTIGKQKLQDVTLLSIGTGFEEMYIGQDTSEWGFGQWAYNAPEKQRAEEPQFPLLSILLNGNIEAASFYSQSLLGSRYHRLNPLLPHPVALDDVKAYDELVELAFTTDIQPTLAFLRKEWN